MATTVSEEVKTFFLGDSTGLVNATKAVNEALKGNEQMEQKVASAIKSIRERQVRDAALAPIVS